MTDHPSALVSVPEPMIEAFRDWYALHFGRPIMKGKARKIVGRILSAAPAAPQAAGVAEDEWSELERLANAATQGPWSTCVRMGGDAIVDAPSRPVARIDYRPDQASRDAEAAYIAAANPATIKRMIASLRAPSREPEGGAVDDLVDRFAAALKEKLHAAEAKHGHGDAWMHDDWRDDLVYALCEHIEKGDPRDVAAYCAFAWHHGWSLALATREEAPADPCASHKDEGISLDPCCPTCEAPAEAGDDVQQTISGETVCGFKVAAWQYLGPNDDAKFGHRYCEHWSTVGNHPKLVVRLFTEDQLRSALRAQPQARSGEGQ